MTIKSGDHNLLFEMLPTRLISELKLEMIMSSPCARGDCKVCQSTVPVEPVPSSGHMADPVPSLSSLEGDPPRLRGAP